MVNDTHLFEDLHLNENNGQVSGIAAGLAIEGRGTFKFDITDNDGKKAYNQSQKLFVRT